MTMAFYPQQCWPILPFPHPTAELAEQVFIFFMIISIIMIITLLILMIMIMIMISILTV